MEHLPGVTGNQQLRKELDQLQNVPSAHSKTLSSKDDDGGSNDVTPGQPKPSLTKLSFPHLSMLNEWYSEFAILQGWYTMENEWAEHQRYGKIKGEKKWKMSSFSHRGEFSTSFPLFYIWRSGLFPICTSPAQLQTQSTIHLTTITQIIQIIM